MEEILCCANFAFLVLVGRLLQRAALLKKKEKKRYINKQPKAFLNFGGSKRNTIGTIPCSNVLDVSLIIQPGSVERMVFNFDGITMIFIAM